MPEALSHALVLVHTLFAFTVLGGLGLLLTAASYDAVDGGVLALVAYGAAPGTFGWWLARRSWEGGTRIWGGLIAVQAWLILGALANLVAGSARGGIQLLLPVLALLFLLRKESRQWYELPELERVERRAFSLARMIRWRRDEGQTAVEYAGLVAIVVALVTALLVSGLGTQIYGGVQSAVCKVAGAGCPAPAEGGDTRAGGNGQGGTGETGTGGTNGTDGTTPDGGADSDGTAGTTTGTTGSDNTTGNGDTTTNAGGNTQNAGEQDDEDDGCFSGFGAFFGCAGNQLKQVGEGLFVDGVWGDLTGMYDLVRHPLDTLGGIADYGKQLGDQWLQDSQGAADKWSKGDYVGAIWDWGGASLNTGGTVLFDTFIGEEAADQWNKGEKTRAVTAVVWNIGSMLIPYYDIGKVAGKLGVLGKLSKLGKLAEKAGKAAEDARKAAKAGDVEAAEKAAKEADEAADEAERKARESGCTIAAPAGRLPYGDSPGLGGPGTGTTVLAAGRADSPYVILAEDGCDGEAKQQAEEARKQADEAEQQTLQARAEAAKAAIRQGKLSIDERNIDDFVKNAKDNPGKKEIGKQQAADALDELADLARRDNVDRVGASKLGSEVTNARTASRLEEMLAEVRGVRRASEDAAPGTTVHTAVGSEHSRPQVEVAPGETVDVSTVPDADVLYKGKDGKINLVEVKNTVNPTRQPEFVGKVNTLSEWKKADPSRTARVEIEKSDKWTEIFRPIKGQKVSPAQLMNGKGIDARIGDASFTAKQLGDMQRALEAKYSRGEEIDWQRLNDDPKGALQYLGLE
ncbi:hypothetical protein [Streptomyces sp. S.PNR 29]|uniref:Flp family type IVb pilin n=1 Tax=Streptomyces sp. S.PNR 29 TaxID=2973805 RepID=UPI0025B078AF|nr:hypothetical protein [Streptomyces sp. S.PNR 29]MDN0195459.1 hypothetical protein [Streptomyces sp. S.PNR 29]